MIGRISKRAVRTTAKLFAAVFLTLAGSAAAAGPQGVVVGAVRAQVLSATLVRVELKGAEGFEDRKTFHVVNRDWPGAAFTVRTNAGVVDIGTAYFIVHVPQAAASLNGVSVTSVGGKMLYEYTGGLTNSQWLPAPADHPLAWSFADAPRMTPPAWGLTPPPQPMPNGGWDLSNNAPDIYIFLPQGNYFQLRKDFLRLTGPTELPPLFMFGAFDSRWYDYSEATALKQIDDYRAHKIPLDVLVVDTGWRAGASTGYRPNTNLFPNLPRFFAEAHARNVKVMFNDHPEPVEPGMSGLAARELRYRFDGLAGLLRDGLDVWWYDRNWSVALVPPMPGLRKEVWGMRLYHDTTARVRPDRRPLIMANVDGIKNGVRTGPMDVAAHRFPFQWTGDIGPGWNFLRRAVENAVYAGAQSLFPYESDDLGGHVANPTTEEYIRWIEYGALSPVYRPHCTHNEERMPWVFGPEAENDARRLLDMRYRLLPVFYAAAHENYETGEPLLRRLDLYFPQFAEARRNDEYLLGQDMLVAPVLQDSTQIVPASSLKTPDGQPGLKAEYFADDNLAGAPAFTRTDANIDFDWSKTSPAPDLPREHFSARWTGTLQIPGAVGDVRLATLEDDGARVWVDGHKVIDAWGAHNSTTTESSATITAGAPHQIRVEYQQLRYGAQIRLMWKPVKTQNAVRVAWVPPGDWRDAWSGKIISGPVLVTNRVPLDQIPVWIKSGAVLPLAPAMQFTGEKPWNPVTLDLYPRAGETGAATLYEDDTRTTAYQRGEFRTTEISASADDSGKIVSVKIGPAQGGFAGALETRGWILRIHAPENWPANSAPGAVKINGQKSNAVIHRLARRPSAMPFGDESGAPDADVYQVALPETPVSKGQTIEVSFPQAGVKPGH